MIRDASVTVVKPIRIVVEFHNKSHDYDKTPDTVLGVPAGRE